MKETPLAYFVTFTCYGTHLHGAQPDSARKDLNQYGAPIVPPNTLLTEAMRRRMKERVYRMSSQERRIVLSAILEGCSHNSWTPHGIHVRSTHVHAVVSASVAPEIVMACFKQTSSNRVRQAGLAPKGTRRWTEHGSTRYLWTREDVEAAVRYVIEEQGEPMALFDGRPLDFS